MAGNEGRNQDTKPDRCLVTVMEQHNKYGEGNIETPRPVTRPLGEQMCATWHAGRCVGDMAREQVGRTRQKEMKRKWIKKRRKRGTRKEMTDK